MLFKKISGIVEGMFKKKYYQTEIKTNTFLKTLHQFKVFFYFFLINLITALILNIFSFTIPINYFSSLKLHFFKTHDIYSQKGIAPVF